MILWSTSTAECQMYSVECRQSSVCHILLPDGLVLYVSQTAHFTHSTKVPLGAPLHAICRASATPLIPYTLFALPQLTSPPRPIMSHQSRRSTLPLPLHALCVVCHLPLGLMEPHSPNIAGRRLPDSVLMSTLSLLPKSTLLQEQVYVTTA